jgi:hypothetical protein
LRIVRKHEVKQICPCARCASSLQNEFAFAHRAQAPFEITLPLRIMRKLALKKFRTFPSWANPVFIAIVTTLVCESNCSYFSQIST